MIHDLVEKLASQAAYESWFLLGSVWLDEKNPKWKKYTRKGKMDKETILKQLLFGSLQEKLEKEK